MRVKKIQKKGNTSSHDSKMLNNACLLCILNSMVEEKRRNTCEDLKICRQNDNGESKCDDDDVNDDKETNSVNEAQSCPKDEAGKFKHHKKDLGNSLKWRENLLQQDSLRDGDYMVRLKPCLKYEQRCVKDMMNELESVNDNDSKHLSTLMGQHF